MAAVEAQGSLLKAAALLGISQPALTRTLHETEEIAQARLFERHARGMRPTAAGAVFARAARRMLAELHRLDDELDALASPGRGSVALGALPVAAAGVLPGVLSRLRQTHPAIRIQLRQGRHEELLSLLAAGEIDMIVGRLYSPAAPDGLLRERLWSEPISILARTGHPVFAQAAIGVEMLRGHDLVLPTISQRVGQEIEHLLAQLGLEPAAALRASSDSFIREMLHGSDVLAVMPRLMLLGDLLRGSLRVVPLPIPAPDRPAGLIVRRDRPLLPAAEAFVACLRGYVAELEAHGLGAITKADGARPESDTTRRTGRA